SAPERATSSAIGTRAARGAGTSTTSRGSAQDGHSRLASWPDGSARRRARCPERPRVVSREERAQESRSRHSVRCACREAPALWIRSSHKPCRLNGARSYHVRPYVATKPGGELRDAPA